MSAKHRRGTAASDLHDDDDRVQPPRERVRPVLPEGPGDRARVHPGALGLLRICLAHDEQGDRGVRRVHRQRDRHRRPRGRVRQRAEQHGRHPEPAVRRLRRGRVPGRRQGRAADVVRRTPPQLAALNRTNTNVQTLAVRAALTGDVAHVHHAVALDPLTAAHLTLDRIAAMTDELLHAHAALLPESLRPASAVTPVRPREPTGRLVPRSSDPARPARGTVPAPARPPVGSAPAAPVATPPLHAGATTRPRRPRLPSERTRHHDLEGEDHADPTIPPAGQTGVPRARRHLHGRALGPARAGDRRARRHQAHPPVDLEHPDRHHQLPGDRRRVRRHAPRHERRRRGHDGPVPPVVHHPPRRRPRPGHHPDHPAADRSVRRQRQPGRHQRAGSRRLPGRLHGPVLGDRRSERRQQRRLPRRGRSDPVDGHPRGDRCPRVRTEVVRRGPRHHGQPQQDRRRRRRPEPLHDGADRDDAQQPRADGTARRGDARRLGHRADGAQHRRGERPGRERPGGHQVEPVPELAAELVVMITSRANSLDAADIGYATHSDTMQQFIDQGATIPVDGEGRERAVTSHRSTRSSPTTSTYRAGAPGDDQAADRRAPRRTAHPVATGPLRPVRLRRSRGTALPGVLARPDRHRGPAEPARQQHLDRRRGVDRGRQLRLHGLGPLIVTALRNTLVFTIGTVPTSMAIGLALAVALNRPLPGRGVFRALFFVPMVAAGVVVGVVMSWIFNGDYGVCEQPARSPRAGTVAVVDRSRMGDGHAGDRRGVDPHRVLHGDLPRCAAVRPRRAQGGRGDRRGVPLGRFPDDHVAAPPTDHFDPHDPQRVFSLQAFDVIYVMTGGGPGFSTTVLIQSTCSGRRSSTPGWATRQPSDCVWSRSCSCSRCCGSGPTARRRRCSDGRPGDPWSFGRTARPETSPPASVVARRRPHRTGGRDGVPAVLDGGVCAHARRAVAERLVLPVPRRALVRQLRPGVQHPAGVAVARQLGAHHEPRHRAERRRVAHGRVRAREVPVPRPRSALRRVPRHDHDPDPGDDRAELPRRREDGARRLPVGGDPADAVRRRRDLHRPAVHARRPGRADGGCSTRRCGGVPDVLPRGAAVVRAAGRCPRHPRLHDPVERLPLAARRAAGQREPHRALPVGGRDGDRDGDRAPVAGGVPGLPAAVRAGHRVDRHQVGPVSVPPPQRGTDTVPPPGRPVVRTPCLEHREHVRRAPPEQRVRRRRREVLAPDRDRRARHRCGEPRPGVTVPRPQRPVGPEVGRRVRTVGGVEVGRHLVQVVGVVVQQVGPHRRQVVRAARWARRSRRSAGSSVSPSKLQYVTWMRGSSRPTNGPVDAVVPGPDLPVTDGGGHRVQPPDPLGRRGVVAPLVAADVHGAAGREGPGHLAQQVCGEAGTRRRRHVEFALVGSDPVDPARTVPGLEQGERSRHVPRCVDLGHDRDAAPCRVVAISRACAALRKGRPVTRPGPHAVSRSAFAVVCPSTALSMPTTRERRRASPRWSVVRVRTGGPDRGGRRPAPGRRVRTGAGADGVRPGRCACRCPVRHRTVVLAPAASDGIPTCRACTAGCRRSARARRRGPACGSSSGREAQRRPDGRPGRRDAAGRGELRRGDAGARPAVPAPAGSPLGTSVSTPTRTAAHVTIVRASAAARAARRDGGPLSAGARDPWPSSSDPARATTSHPSVTAPCTGVVLCGPAPTRVEQTGPTVAERGRAAGAAARRGDAARVPARGDDLPVTDGRRAAGPPRSSRPVRCGTPPDR
ncbi:hypothetical protein Pfo_031630, partial [Paulownia fortunei]